ncbi:MAG: hypothetical protein PWQ24_1964 [Mesotoga sp.]|jgi:hypothetical protein|nr:hypothetical protein [Mesotoga sp.]
MRSRAGASRDDSLVCHPDNVPGQDPFLPRKTGQTLGESSLLFFSPLIEKPEEEQRDDVLESDFDTIAQYESV